MLSLILTIEIGFSFNPQLNDFHTRDKLSYVSNIYTIMNGNVRRSDFVLLLQLRVPGANRICMITFTSKLQDHL